MVLFSYLWPWWELKLPLYVSLILDRLLDCILSIDIMQLLAHSKLCSRPLPSISSYTSQIR
jgi:hypothetical protein